MCSGVWCKEKKKSGRIATQEASERNMSVMPARLLENCYRKIWAFGTFVVVFVWSSFSLSFSLSC